MENALVALGGSFLAAGLLARMGRSIGLPTIPFFMAAGILTGPFTPGLVLVDHPRELSVFASVGLVLLLFHLGIEFSLRDLTAGGARLVKAGTTYLALNIGGGFVFGYLLGWGIKEALIIAGAVGISSTAIATKLLVELKRLANRETGMILGVIVFEDIFLALYLAFLQPVLEGSEGTGALFEISKAFGFLLLLFAVARFGARFVGRLISSDDDELMTVLFVGFALVMAGIAHEFGVSDAIGALMAGLIIAETTAAPRVERLVLPLRDAFAAVFFFAFGLTIDPGEASSVAGPVAIAVAMTIVLNIGAGVLGARIYGLSPRGAANAGLTLLGRGEFALIIATLAASAGLDPRIGPFVALYVLILAIMGPLVASRSGLLADRIPDAFVGRSEKGRGEGPGGSFSPGGGSPGTEG